MIEMILTSAIGLITGAGSILLFFPQIRRSKILENEAKQSEEWQKLYQEQCDERREERLRYEERIKQKDETIDKLFEDITRHRDEKAEKSKRIAELEVENTRLQLLKCELPKCINRKPPTGY